MQTVAVDWDALSTPVFSIALDNNKRRYILRVQIEQISFVTFDTYLILDRTNSNPTTPSHMHAEQYYYYH